MRVLAAALILAAGASLPARGEIAVTTVTSPGGITAWFYENHAIPILSIEASFQGGAALDPVGREGAANLMAALLDEGAGDLDARAFAEAEEALAARLDFRAGRDSIGVSARMLTETRAPTLELLRSALVAPRFDAEAVERMRARMLSSLRADATDPGALAARAFDAEVFAGHPYARPAEGTPESVAAIDRAAIGDAHRAGLVRDRLRIAVAGDITPGELGPILDEVFGALPAGGPPLPSVAEVRAPGTVEVIDLDIPQSVVLFGEGGIARDDPDYIPAFVMDRILGGGGFSSRLMREVREKRGLTYGISTWLQPDDFGQLYMGRFSSANERAAEAVAIVRAEWRRMAEEGVTAEELVAAKRYLTGAWPLRFDGNARIAEQLLGLQTAGLGPDYLARRNALVAAVTVEDVARVARRMLDPARLTFVVVGRPEGLSAD